MTDQDPPREPDQDDPETATEETAKGGAVPQEGGAGEGTAADLEWLATLEERVREAVARLGELGQENERLGNRVAELEERLAEAEAAAEVAPAETAAAAADAGEWRQEREEIRTRVQRLTDDLESLLGEG